MRIGILGTADIAFRRFLPALQKCSDITYVGVASRTPEKAVSFTQVYGGKAYSSYEKLLEDRSIDAIYVPLPPALHYEWGKKVLESEKHLLMEKPFTTNLAGTKELLALAEEKKLVVHENYMFLYHSQLEKIKQLIFNGILGELRLIRAAFGFPKRSKDDFRYKKVLGGGSLLDCGGYPVRLALELLGETTKIIQANLHQPEGYEVDLFGSAVLQNDSGLCAQISFGMDNIYKCELEIWGNKSCIFTDRIFTAPPDFYPSIIFHTKDIVYNKKQNSDDAFANSIRNFIERVLSSNEQGKNAQIKKQAELIEKLKEKSR